MALDFAKIPPARRARYVSVGKQYGSEDVLAQAAQTLAGFAQYGTEVADFGYVKKDAEALALAHKALGRASLGREDRRAERHGQSLRFRQALAQGKQARLRARAILTSVEGELADAGQGEPERLSTVLQHTRSAGRDAQKLREQLEQLLAVFFAKDMAPLAKPRGGTGAVTALRDAIALLQDAEGQLSAGTTEATEEMDLLDGYIMESARRARRAARAAAAALARPDIARAFALTAGKSHKSPAAPSPASPPAPATP